MNVVIRSHSYADTHAYMHARMHAHAHAHTHIQTNIRTRINTVRHKSFDEWSKFCAIYGILYMHTRV